MKPLLYCLDVFLMVVLINHFIEVYSTVCKPELKIFKQLYKH